MTIVSGHQPAYLPWLGLLHKASLCDIFVYMDDVQFLDRDFIHRNRIVATDGNVIWLTVPVDRRNSSSLRISDIRIKDDQGKNSWRYKHWASLKTCYGKTKYFKEYAPFFEWLYLENTWQRLADLNLAILRKAFEWFEIQASIVVGSALNFSGKKSDLVLDHCRRFNANTVVTGTHGKDYIIRQDFEKLGIKVFFQDYKHPEYSQRIRQDFVPCLSFVDLLFNHGADSAFFMIKENVCKREIESWTQATT
ncbi:WbqC-like protein family protein [Desulfonatronum thiosulfatophilum]|uniref:WbqC-like protein family protein n=1 Tax=Desulfonatronum thiosulfatophilum TaxID=617002 RepID=A0A1G6DUX0_9BACT|nr:WbqC family protein [Desulfonatronum thiosulfatophilum]SDB48974.1 WbqC-like protein family protein [Desulfonatronum thiosulfatophilum]